MYCGDLIAIAQRAAVRPDLRFTEGLAAKAYFGTRSDVYTCWSGEDLGDPRLNLNVKKPDHFGAFGNLKEAMIPEWTWVEDPSRSDSYVVWNGWRALVRRWLIKKIIHPTEEVRTLLGESDFSRWMLAR